MRLSSILSSMPTVPSFGMDSDHSFAPILGFDEVFPVRGSLRTKIRAESSSNGSDLRSAGFTPRFRREGTGAHEGVLPLQSHWLREDFSLRDGDSVLDVFVAPSSYRCVIWSWSYYRGGTCPGLVWRHCLRGGKVRSGFSSVLRRVIKGCSGTLNFDPVCGFWGSFANPETTDRATPSAEFAVHGFLAPFFQHASGGGADTRLRRSLEFAVSSLSPARRQVPL